MLQLKQLGISTGGEKGQEPLFPEVSLTVQDGQILVIMGPSGCGKSTLLAAIAGNLAPPFQMTGTIHLGDTALEQLPAQQRKVGLLYQDDLLFPHMNVLQNLAFALPASLDRKQRAQRIAQALSHADLQGFQHRDISTLSGGERARISLLRTLLAEPRAILLDEPFNKLDKTLREQFRDWVFSELRRYRIPTILVTHDADDCGDNEIYDLVKGE
jgi:putative thiamine transport system ATP-binding protein